MFRRFFERICPGEYSGIIVQFESFRTRPGILKFESFHTRPGIFELPE
jgi:hypothetical protein